MHMVIRAIVYANNKKEAVSQAEDVFEGLVERTTFDYYQMFDKEDKWGGAKERWGNYSIAYKYNSKKGKKLVIDGWDSTYNDFKVYFDKAKEILAKCKSVDELLRRDSMDRWYIGRLGAYEGSCCWLYDNDGSGITDEEHLDKTISKWKCFYEDKGKKNPYADLDLWVVPADVHF